MLSFPFALHKPYLSKDDTEFYIIDNPVKKDRVFKVPYVAPSQWKGALRSAMMRMMVEDLKSGRIQEDKFVERRLQLCRLFGNEKDGAADFLNRALTRHRMPPLPEDAGEEESEKRQQQFEKNIKAVADEFEQLLREKRYRVGDIEGFQGRLYFFPTFFDKVGLEVINPHDRKTGVGARGPILMECVPAGAEGTFTLLYVPLGFHGESGDELHREAAQDLEMVAKGIRAMLTEYGFGAKTSSGFGVANDELPNDGSLLVKAVLGVREKKENDGDGEDPPPGIKTKEQLQDYLNEDGSLKTREKYKALMESRGQRWGKRSERRFNAVKAWFEQNKKRTSQARELQEAGITRLSFSTLVNLVNCAEEVTQALQEGGDEQ